MTSQSSANAPSTTRVVAWFSCGAASAVAAKRALATASPDEKVVVAYCDTMASEHPDNQRFFDDVQEWLGLEVMRLSGKYDSVDEVFMGERYMAGIGGARCTVEMKKRPRFRFQRPDDIHVFGFTSDERARIARFRDMNVELLLRFPLQDEGITKDECFDTLAGAGIRLPTMYELGYQNNNCLGCVKATSARYWNQTRRDFPEVFARRVAQSRELGVRLTRVRGERRFLDELPADYLPAEPMESISCGPDCGDQLAFDLGGEAP